MVLLTIRVNNLRKRGVFFERDAPAMLSLKMLYGSHDGLHEPSSILLSASAAKSFFDEGDPVGKIMSSTRTWM
jgi:hypothetical protein